MSGLDDANEARRRYGAPYTKHRPVPTIQKYRAEQEARRAEAAADDFANAPTVDRDVGRERPSSGRTRTWYEYWSGEREKTEPHDGEKKDGSTQDNDDDDDDDDDDDEGEFGAAVDTSEADPLPRDAKQRRKMIGRRRGGDEREVTDPVTHLPVRISDFTQSALKDIEENPPPFGATLRTATGLENKKKSKDQLEAEIREMQDGHESMRMLFPPPSYDEFRIELIQIMKQGVTVGLLGCAAIILAGVGIERSVVQLGKTGWFYGLSAWTIIGAISSIAILYLLSTVRAWAANRIRDIWAAQVWEAHHRSAMRDAKAHETEPVAWLNSLVSSVWPLINPDLFTSLADTLEDVMQASLPSFIQMVSVEDIGQGSEAFRIQGVRWLPSGAAARSVGSDGKLESPKHEKESPNDRQVPGEGEVDVNANSNDGAERPGKPAGKNKDNDGNDYHNSQPTQDGEDMSNSQVAEGMEAEEGDFINLEVAFAYRTRPPRSLSDRSKDIHLYLAFYLPGNLKIPIWVDVRGIIGIARMRLQLTPDPPFFALCTLTFLGQPKVDISCIPLIRYGPNIMDLPLIKNFVQSSVDAAMAEYVAPKSLTLDLKDMLAGDDFKKDTHARGVLVVYIKSGYDFKCGDAAIPLIREAGADPYVSVGFAKFGKPMWSTRVLEKEMHPSWHETCYLPITPEELNVDERLRVQLWDSDRFTADDDLGRIELDIKELMKSENSNGKMWDRVDGFRALKAGEDLPGKLVWSVGYFSKTRLQKCQFEKQTYDPEIKSMDQLKAKVERISQRKLREAQVKKGRHSKTDEELKQQKAQEMKAMQDAITISTPPPDDYPSGILGIQIHQITNLEFSNTQKSQADETTVDNEEVEEGQDLPSAYCNIIINHNKVFRTRTKPKNARPFYNAGTERFIKDWRNTEVFVAVRDQRLNEDDPLLGIVHLPLSELFAERSQTNETYPLAGGIGYGRIRISLVWRSVQLQAPEKLLGWDFGTLEVQPSVFHESLPQELHSLDLKFHTNLSSGKMYPKPEETEWRTKKGETLKLAVHKRYSSCLAIRIKHKARLQDRTHAFSILWLKDLADEKEEEICLPVWKGNFERAKSCTLDECGEKIGTIRFKVKFWSGLGSAHAHWARRDPNLRNVMEVLETAQDNLDSQKAELEAGIVGGDESDYSSSSDSDEDSSNDEGTTGKDGKERDENGKMSMVDQFRDYKKHAKQKHRQNKGIMQYKIPRTAQWAFNKAGRVEHKIGGIFRRHTRQPGIETEV